MIKKLTEIVSDITKGAEEISFGSVEISKSSQIVAQVQQSRQVHWKKSLHR